MISKVDIHIPFSHPYKLENIVVGDVYMFAAVTVEIRTESVYGMSRSTLLIASISVGENGGSP